MVKAIVRKVSGTNMVERAPRGKKAPALVKGANGAALAMWFIQEAEKRGDEVLQVQISMKDKLRKLVELGREDHIEYRKALEARRVAINEEAKKAGISLNAFREADARSNSIYAEISEWLKFSSACETGWKPDLDKAWAEIKKAATKALDAQAAAAEQAQRAMKGKEIKAALLKESDPAKKAVLEAELVLNNAKQVANPEAAGPGQTQSATGRRRGGRPSAPAKPLFDSIMELCKDRPLQDVERAYMLMGEYVKTLQAKATPQREVKATPPGRAAGTEVKREPIAAKKSGKGGDKPSRK